MSETERGGKEEQERGGLAEEKSGEKRVGTIPYFEQGIGSWSRKGSRGSCCAAGGRVGVVLRARCHGEANGRAEEVARGCSVPAEEALEQS